MTYPKLKDSVMVVLLNEKAPGEWEKVEHYLKQEKYITNRDARDILGMSDTVKVSKLFRSWVSQGLLIKIVPRSGSKRNIRYRLPTGDERHLFTVDKGK